MNGDSEGVVVGIDNPSSGGYPDDDVGDEGADVTGVGDIERDGIECRIPRVVENRIHVVRPEPPGKHPVVRSILSIAV
ncbi:MAG: hypothetical protein KDA91_16925, partial [Planctomycetaceae bacterium]|nr:hypothetical protein [Planctomycetaceae bacterium]